MSRDRKTRKTAATGQHIEDNRRQTAAAATITGGSTILVWEEHWQGVWGTKYSSRARGRAPVRVWGKAPRARRMLRHEAEKSHLRRERTSPID